VTFGLAALIAAYALVAIFDLRVGFGSSSGNDPNFPSGGPKEFLYLDSVRVNAYLGQINGGSFNSEKQTKKLTEAVNGKLEIAGALEGGASKNEEDLAEREIKPTDASRYFALYAGLADRPQDLSEISLRHFRKQVKPLHEGQFVQFETSTMLSPIYLNSYLAARQRGTRDALFPGKSADAKRERKAAKEFVKRLGDPRVVFALHPEGHASVYLLPMEAQRLSNERSLLKYGGGQFTVVGKVVRVFPEHGDLLTPRYVDSATLETWEKPLRNAPGQLICRTEPSCAKPVRAEGLRGAALRAKIEASRERELRALHRETAIPRRGAVILPIAVYK
jgi:hypothetical protein